MIRSAEIIAIGTEILLGDIINTNASIIARELAHLGINTYHQQVVGDNSGRLKEALKTAYQSADLVITSGGLGPTEDDLSKEVAADYFQADLVMDEIALEHIQRYLTGRGRQITPNNYKQAMLPVGAMPLYNHNGTAPGFILSKDQKMLIMLPGPPSELIPLLTEQVIPYLKGLTSTTLVSRTLHIAGIGESRVESILHDQMLTMQNPTLAPYAKEGVVDLRITAKADNEDEAYAMIRPVETEIRDLFKEAVFGKDEETLESVVIRELKNQQMTLATLEGATAGMLSTKLGLALGADGVYQGGWVAAYPSVLSGTLGTVESSDTEDTVLQLCRRLRGVTNVEVAIVLLGASGALEKQLLPREYPEGTYWIGLSVKDTEIVQTVRLMRLESSNREMAVAEALNLLRLQIASRE